MSLHFDYPTVNPEATRAMMQFQQYSQKMQIAKPLQELIKIRASQINGCAFCLDMHYRDARAAGESERRLATISAFEESGLFTDAECAALALTEAVTTISIGGVPEALYEEVRKYYDESEYVELIMAINIINCWNRLSVSTGRQPPKD